MFEEIAGDAIETKAETACLLDQRNGEMVQSLQPTWQTRKLGAHDPVFLLSEYTAW